MQDENTCTTCGHDKWSHAISLKGVVGWCMKTLIEGWSYCDCKKFTSPNKESVRDETVQQVTVNGLKALREKEVLKACQKTWQKFD